MNNLFCFNTLCIKYSFLLDNIISSAILLLRNYQITKSYIIIGLQSKKYKCIYYICKQN